MAQLSLARVEAHPSRAKSSSLGALEDPEGGQRSPHLLGSGGWSIPGVLSGQSPFPVGGKDLCVSLLFFPFHTDQK